MEWEKFDSRSLTTGETQSERGAANEPGSCHFLSTVFSPVSSLQKASASQARRGQMEMSSEQKEERKNVMPPGEAMKVDSQEGLLAMGLEIEIRY